MLEFTSLSPQHLLDLAKPCKEYEELLQNMVSFDLEWSRPHEALKSLRTFVAMADQRDEKDPSVSEENLQAPARDGHLIDLTLFRPTSSTFDADSTKDSPLIVLYFGGGFVIGSPTALATTARSLVKQFSAIVVAPKYRLAPEHPFPAGVNDGWDSLDWIAKNATGAIGSNPSKGFVIGGISAGGSIANVITHLARDRGLSHPLTGLWLSAPGVRLAGGDYTRLPEKYRERHLSRTQPECVNSAIFPPGMTKLMVDFLEPDRRSELYAPLIWPTETNHKGLPKTYSQVCGIDTGRDELLMYDDMLKSDGVKTRLDLYAGLPHCFWHSFKQLPQSKQRERDTLDGFAWLLETQ